MFGIGWTELLFILVIALLVLGPTKLPDVAKGLGRSLREFKRALSDIESEEEPNFKDASYSKDNTRFPPTEKENTP